MGRLRNELLPNLRSVVQGSQTIFYYATHEEVVIVRILHGSVVIPVASLTPTVLTGYGVAALAAFSVTSQKAAANCGTGIPARGAAGKDARTTSTSPRKFEKIPFSMQKAAKAATPVGTVTCTTLSFTGNPIEPSS